MTKAMENDIPPDPRQIGLGSPGTVVKSFQRIAQTLHEFRWTPHGFFKTGCGDDGIAHRSGSRATDLPSWNPYIESRITGLARLPVCKGPRKRDFQVANVATKAQFRATDEKGLRHYFLAACGFRKTDSLN